MLSKCQVSETLLMNLIISTKIININRGNFNKFSSFFDFKKIHTFFSLNKKIILSFVLKESHFTLLKCNVLTYKYLSL